MDKKIASTIIATAIAVNNISTTTVLSKPITTRTRMLKHNENSEKVYGLNNNLEQTFKENVLDVVEFESNVFNEGEFISLIKEGTIDVVKLDRDLDLTSFKDEEMIVTAQGLTIDGGGKSIILPAFYEELNKKCFTIKGNDVIIKNVNFIVKNKNSRFSGSKCDAINIVADGVQLKNINIQSEDGRGINIYNCKDVILDNVNIKTSKEYKSALKIDNGNVKLKNLNINNDKGIGIEVVGRQAKVNIEDSLQINSNINIRAQKRDGAEILCNNQQIALQEKFFGYEIYKAIKPKEFVKSEEEFLSLINNPNVDKLILKTNLDLRKYEKALILRAMSNVIINENQYHISFL
ncbi:hypothetical protein [Clostridium tarantellae]|uniref:Right handed beta helix domain-containing protein n=1 Tax=Clostridium tarantellae TaxID=39493 RepID=A0A6I1MHG1_9CLOT|nr:hypothetical protein [Clostridium tarantellae]MPQ42284.1 hypothetical protein [Clostridium tarantellae]